MPPGIGVGAIGGVVGGMLTRGGHDVTLIDQWPEHIEAMRANGLTITTRDDEYNVKVNALHISDLQNVSEKFDYGFVAVKSYDTEWATALIDNYVKPGGAVVDFQNGINDERVAAIVGTERAMACIITIGAGLYEPGHVVRSDANPLGFKIGEHDGSDSARANELAGILSAVAEAKVTTNMWGDRWSKLAVNCMANPVAGLSGLGSAEVRTDPTARRIAIRMGAEVITVARALGHGFSATGTTKANRDVIPRAAKARPKTSRTCGSPNFSPTRSQTLSAFPMNFRSGQSFSKPTTSTTSFSW